MTRQIEELEASWEVALDTEDAAAVEAIVKEVLQEHTRTALAAELRYRRGMLTLTEGEGTGMERLAKALGEFEEGCKSGDATGPAAEPWRTLNRTQFGICTARRGNIQDAERSLKAAADYRPRSPAGLGALALLMRVLEDAGKAREAKRYHVQRLSYARALVREHPDPPDLYSMQLYLSQELLDSNYAAEGQALLESLGQLDEETLGTELYEDIQALLAPQDAP